MIDKIILSDVIFYPARVIRQTYNIKIFQANDFTYHFGVFRGMYRIRAAAAKGETKEEIIQNMENVNKQFAESMKNAYYYQEWYKGLYDGGKIAQQLVEAIL